ncbi:hypothetical protein [Empedobacter falsenii]|uniref:Uncharacterized protein n=2 Tax=Empedobacter falsenii TaxID=343874 RepID=A0AAW7DMV5_9FLAO|nr:hypothetical protein [Empedobacter falsenii]MDM1552905.1 hypothetical protein [Empedobacter falsenii]
MLHVNGDIKIRNLQFKASDSNYSRVLAIDNQGNIDYVDKSSITPESNGNVDKVIVNNTYTTSGGTPINTEYLKCGKFEFSYISNSNTGDVRFRLAEAPSSTIKVYTTFEQNWDGNGFQYQASSTAKEFTTENNFIDVPFNILVGQAQIANGEYNELYLSYPKEQDFYRVSFYRVQQNSTTYWVTACEKF